MKSSNQMVKDLFERRENYFAAQKRRRKTIARAAVPACLCLVLLIGAGVLRAGFNHSGGAGKEAASSGEKFAVYTDSVDPPDGEAADMLGCLVYKGKIYTQSPAAENIKTPKEAEKLIGEYVGQAKCILNEWSTREDFSREFASNYSGGVYKVNDYDDDFRLCVYENSDDGFFLQILDNYDKIGLNTGADLFEKRLHITGNLQSADCLSHAEWNEGTSPRRKLGVTGEQLEEFLAALCESPFVKIDQNKTPDLYDTAKQGHLYLNMKDGTAAELRLIDGGYVGFGELGGIFVKMPGDPFDKMLSACE